MKFQRNPVHGFTSKANGLVRELKNDIFVSDAYKPEAGVPPPPREKFVCLWDTGATNTVITKKVVDGLSLKPSGRTVVRTVGQGSDFNEYEVNTYLVNLFLPNNVVVAAVPVSECIFRSNSAAYSAACRPPIPRMSATPDHRGDQDQE